MESRYARKFNHDSTALGYDRDVADESHPIRAGYSALLDWVAAEAAVTPAARVLELGVGTGNLAARLSPCERLVCVDVSGEMLRLAREKLAGATHVEFVQADLLRCFETLECKVDVLVSTYAVHHLPQDEKLYLLRATVDALAPGGRAVFGDLMFTDTEHREQYLAHLQATGQTLLRDDIEDEFFWDLESAVQELQRLGLRVETEQFSELSFGLAARAPLQPDS